MFKGTLKGGNQVVFLVLLLLFLFLLSTQDVNVCGQMFLLLQRQDMQNMKAGEKRQSLQGTLLWQEEVTTVTLA